MWERWPSEMELFMTSTQARRLLRWMATISRVWCGVFATAFVLSIAGVIPMLCVPVFGAATIAGLVILTIVVARSSRQMPDRRVRSTWEPDFHHCDNEVWRSRPTCSQELDMPFNRTAGHFDDWHRTASECHMSVTVYDLNADGTPNFAGNGVFSSGTRDIEI